MDEPLSSEALGALFKAIDCEPTGKLSELAKIAGLSLAEDYIGADLSNENLSEDNLSGANFSNANLSNSNFSSTDLSGANLNGANLSGANLNGANLSGANLSGADLSDADLNGADLSGVDLSGAILNNANLINLPDAPAAAKEIHNELDPTKVPIALASKLPPVSQNPFTVGQPVPPERFVGRTSEIDAAFDQIFNRSHLAIWGGPGMGKSSFLEQLASPQVWKKHGQEPSNAVIVLLSCESIQPFSASDFWRKVLSILRDQLDSESALQAEIETLLEQGQATKDSLRQVLRMLGKQGKFLLLLVDDYDAALNSNEQYTEADMRAFLSECRNLANHCQERKHFSMIVTSLKRLNELGPALNPTSSPWYNHYLFQSLKPFTNTEVGILLGIQMTPALRDAIREIAGGHPALLQIAGFLLYRKLHAGQGQALDAEAFAREFESATRQIFQNIWERCTKEEKILLKLMALSSLKGRLDNMHYDLSGIDLIFSQREKKELTNLEEQGVIIRKEKAGKTVYSFTSSIMERWVIQEIENSDEPSLQERQMVFLNLMSHKQAEKVTTATRWLLKHKNDVPSAFEWFGRVSADWALLGF